MATQKKRKASTIDLLINVIQCTPKHNKTTNIQTKAKQSTTRQQDNKTSHPLCIPSKFEAHVSDAELCPIDDMPGKDHSPRQAYIRSLIKL